MGKILYCPYCQYGFEITQKEVIIHHPTDGIDRTIPIDDWHVKSIVENKVCPIHNEKLIEKVR